MTRHRGTTGPASRTTVARAGGMSRLCYLHHAGGLPLVPRGLRRGPGRAAECRALSIEAATDDTIEAYASAALPRLRELASESEAPLVLYGHSMGGLVAYECCRQLGRDAPRLVRSLVLAACAPVWLLEPGALDLPIADADRFNRHVRALLGYRPDSAPDPGVRVHLISSANDIVVPQAASLKWAELGWDHVITHILPGAGHLFHTAADVTPAFVTEWGSVMASVDADHYREGSE